MAEAWRMALNDIWTTYHHPEHNARCKTTLLQNHAVIHMKRLLLGVFPVDYITQSAQDLFVLPNVAVIVAKKLNKKLLPSFHESSRGADFYSQQHIPGLEPLPRVICGGVLADDFASLLGVYITHPHSGGVAYNWALNITQGCQLVDDLQTRMDLSPEEEAKPRTNPFKPKHGKSIEGPNIAAGAGS